MFASCQNFMVDKTEIAPTPKEVQRQHPSLSSVEKENGCKSSGIDICCGHGLRPQQGKTSLTPMSVHRKSLPVYDFCCSHIENFYAYFQDLSQKHGLDIASVKKLFIRKVLQNIHMHVNEELVDSVQRSSLQFKKDEDKTSLQHEIIVYVTNLNDMPHFEELVKFNKRDKKNVLLLVVESDCKADEVLNVPDEILFARTTTDKFEDDLNDLLERWVCDICYLMVESLQQFQTKTCTGTEGNCTGETEEVTELLRKIENFYYKTTVPQIERPEFEKRKKNGDLGKIYERLNKINGVIGCGEHNDIIHILIDEDGDVAETRIKIAETLGPVKFSCKTVSKNLRHLNYPGARVNIPNIEQKESYGTLGGFLTAKDSSQNSTLYAVTAGHVSEKANGILKIEDDVVLGYFLGNWEHDKHKDINVADITNDKHKSTCDLKLRDDNDKPMCCALLDLDSEKSEDSIPGLIHIKGASSGISYGEIDTVRFYEEGAPTNCMLAQDRKGVNKPFCKPGDSGSIVCSNDRRGKFVNVIGTVVGQYASREKGNSGYLVLHLNSGITHLNQRYQIPFELCEQYKK